MGTKNCCEKKTTSREIRTLFSVFGSKYCYLAKTSLKNAFLQRYSFAQPKNSLVRIIEDYANLTIMFMNRRKINTEGKGRRAACRALAILHQDDLNNRMKRSKEFNQFCPPSSSDDLSLLFCINPSFMFYIG